MSVNGGSVRFLKNLVLSRPEHESAIRALGAVLERVEAALKLRSEDAVAKSAPRVVTVVPPHFLPSMIVDCYQAGLRHFGESTPHELIRKAEHEDVLQHCPDIKWHFYGPLQPSVATGRLVGTANLYMIESVHNETVATVLERSAAREKLGGLKVMVQVAANQEDQQLGIVSPEATHKLCRHIAEDCPHLELCGLMINPAGGGRRQNNNRSTNNDEVVDAVFQTLTTTQLDVCRRLQIELDEFELSMGGPWDYERAIEMGSTIVRIALDSQEDPYVDPVEGGGGRGGGGGGGEGGGGSEGEGGGGGGGGC